jgi:osmotically-inducible protein OsmY
MRIHVWSLGFCGILAISGLAGCSGASSKSPEVTDSIRQSLSESHLSDVSVSQDRDKGVVTLGGHVAGEGDKAHAESIARSFAGNQVVANQIAVIPAGVESDAKKMNSSLDKGIEGNLDALLIQDQLHDSVKYAVKNSVVTLSGDVDSQAKRTQAQELASTVPNVQQVVNELQVKGQKATSSN